ncbi:MAG: HD domain-containing protein [Anaerolineales bacterium]|nr:HD domain-containing protein [Anaerolineales bacterium]
MPTIEEARDYYPVDDAVHGFSHILRVYRLCEQIGKQENADLTILRAAALLHDVEGDVDVRENHHLAAARFAEETLKNEGWEEEAIRAVVHCIRAHRFRDDSEKPQTLEAQILFDADKIDAIGAVGVARAVAYAVRAGMDVYAPPSDQYLLTGELAPGESQTVAHEYLFKLRHIKDRLFTVTGRSLAAKRHELMVKFFDGWLNEIGDYS